MIKLKKEYIFIVINYAIFFICWALFKSGIAYTDNDILFIVGLVTLLIHTLLILGGEGIIYCIFSSKNEPQLVFKILVISILVNICISIIIGMSDIIIYLTINQIVGIMVGRIYHKVKYKQ
mgnify:FL=1